MTKTPYYRKASVGRAVRLLNDVIEFLSGSRASRVSQDRVGVLLVKLRRARAFLLRELEKDPPDYFKISSLIKKCAKWVIQSFFNNLLWIFRLQLGRRFIYINGDR